MHARVACCAAVVGLTQSAPTTCLARLDRAATAAEWSELNEAKAGFEEFDEDSPVYDLVRKLKGGTYMNISLEGVPLNHASMAVIVPFVKYHSLLRHLVLTAARLDDASADMIGEALSRNRTMTRLDLDGNHIGPVGAAAVAQGLKMNCTLRELMMNENPIGNEGASRLAEALKTNLSLHTLGLRRCAITADVAVAFEEALETNSSMTDVFGLTSKRMALAMKRNKGWVGELVKAASTNNVDAVAAAMRMGAWGAVSDAAIKVAHTCRAFKVERLLHLSRSAPGTAPKQVRTPECNVAGCGVPFGVVAMRYFCANCGRSYCETHCTGRLLLPQFGLLVPQIVCDKCFPSQLAVVDGLGHDDCNGPDSEAMLALDKKRIQRLREGITPPTNDGAAAGAGRRRRWGDESSSEEESSDEGSDSGSSGSGSGSGASADARAGERNEGGGGGGDEGGGS